MSQCPFNGLMQLENFADGAPYELFAQGRSECPVSWEEESVSVRGGHWNVFRKQDIDAVMKNPALFTNTRGPNLEDSPPELIEGDMQSLNLMDPPKHRHNRALIDYAFKPAEIRKRADDIRAIARELIDAIIDRGECEFVSALAAPLPVRVICEILGVPEAERDHVYALVNASVLKDDEDFSGSREEGFMAHARLVEYGTELAADHRRAPRDSLTMEVLNAEVDGQGLSDHDYGLLFHNLIVGGIETTRNAIAYGLHELIRHPEQFARLREDPALIADAVEEMLRFRAPVVYYRRTALQDTELGGQQIRAGDTVICWLASANRDETVFAESDRFDITRNQREPIKRHYRTFGVGPHFCVGVHLARLELQIAFEEITARMDRVRLRGEPSHVRSMFMDGYKQMPIAFERAAP